MQTVGRHEIYFAQYVGSVVYRNVNISACTSFAHYYYLMVIIRPVFSAHIVEDVVVL